MTATPVDSIAERDREWWKELCGLTEIPPIPAMVKRWIFERLTHAIQTRAQRERDLLSDAKARIEALEAALRPLLKGTKHSWDGIKSMPRWAGCKCTHCTARALLPENRDLTDGAHEAAIEAASVLRGI